MLWGIFKNNFSSSSAAVPDPTLGTFQVTQRWGRRFAAPTRMLQREPGWVGDAVLGRCGLLTHTDDFFGDFGCFPLKSRCLVDIRLAYTASQVSHQSHSTERACFTGALQRPVPTSIPQRTRNTNIPMYLRLSVWRATRSTSWQHVLPWHRVLRAFPLSFQ